MMVFLVLVRFPVMAKGVQQVGYVIHQWQTELRSRDCPSTPLLMVIPGGLTALLCFSFLFCKMEDNTS